MSYRVWEWRDEDRVVKFVGTGRATIAQHPAEKMWNERRENDSPLGRWLCQLDDEPERRDLFEHPIPKAQALSVVVIRRNLHEITVLSNRDRLSYRGGGHPRIVVGPDGFYGSVRAAAKDVGVNASTITRRCRDTLCREWGYIEDLDI